jgi:hypothetical protein
MSFAQVWTYLRWPLAIVGLLAIVNYALPRLPEALAGMIEFDPSGSILAPDEDVSESESALDVPVAELESPTLQPGTGPVTDGAAVPVADFSVNDTIADIDTDALTLSDDTTDAVVIAFDIPAGDPGCMSAMTLDLTAAEVLSATEIGVWASTLDTPVEVVDNQLVEGDLRVGTTPMATALVEAEGQVAIDVLGGFQSYFLQDFAEGRPFVLTIMATTPVEPLGGVSFVSANVETEDVPTLLWSGTPGCPIGPTDLPTE